MKHIFTALISICTIFLTQAQTTPTNMQWESELQIEQEYHPIIKEAQKISFSPEINEPKAPSEKKIELSDYTINCPISLEFQEPNLNNFFFFTEKKSMVKKGYLNVGISTAIHTDIKLGYRILSSEKIQWNILNDYEWNNETRTTKTKKTGDYLFATDYQQYFRGLTLVADAQYLYSAFNYPNEDNNRVNLFKIYAEIMSEEHKSVNYELHLNYDVFKYQGEQEINSDTENYRAFGFNLRAAPDFMDQIRLSGVLKSANMDQIGLSGVLKSANREKSSITIHPYSILRGEKWNADMGFEINVALDKPLFITPKLSLHWNPKEATALHALIQGGITDNRNSLSFFETHYLKPHTKLRDSKSYDATLYSDFRLFPQLSWNVLFSYQWIWDEHFFYPEQHSSNLLNAIYMNGNVLKVGTSLWYSLKDFFQFQIKGTYYQWSHLKWPEEKNNPEHLHPYNCPSLVGNIDIYLHMKSMPLAWNIQYQSIIGNPLNFLKNIHYASLHAVYQLKDWVSISVSLNNLFFQRYDFWCNYPVQNSNFMCGANFKF